MKFQRLVLWSVAALFALSASPTLATASAPENELKCTTRHWIDPVYAPKAARSLERILRKKGYQPLAYNAPYFEKYRVVAAYVWRTTDGRLPYVRFYFQEFRAPNFFEVLRVEVPANDLERDEVVIGLFAQIPEC